MKRLAGILAGISLAAALFVTVQAQDQDDPFGPEGSLPESEPPLASRESIEEKLREIVFPSVELPGVPADVVFDFIQSRSRELDHGTAHSQAKGINLVFRPDPGAGNQAPDRFAPEPMVEISLRDAQLGTVLAAAARKLGKEVWIENSAVVVGSADQKPDPNAGKPDVPIPGLETARLPAVEFVGTPLDVSVELLRTRYRELAAKGGNELPVRFVGKVKTTDNFGESYPRIDLHLRNVSLYDAFAHVACQAGLRLEVTEEEVRMVGGGDGE